MAICPFERTMICYNMDSSNASLHYKDVEALKPFFSGILLLLLFVLLPAIHTQAAQPIQLTIDGVPIVSDVAPEIKKGRTMVPLRVISESLVANVAWSNKEVTLAKQDLNAKLTLNSKDVMQNKVHQQLEAAPYLKNNRTMVPLRFIAETFGCQVTYDKRTVAVNCNPLRINGMETKAFQAESLMTMGTVIREFHGNELLKALYEVIEQNKGKHVQAPAERDGQRVTIRPDIFSILLQYDFMDVEGKSVKHYEIYVKASGSPNLDGSNAYSDILLYDANNDVWYEFNEDAIDKIWALQNNVSELGLSQLIHYGSA